MSRIFASGRPGRAALFVRRVRPALFGGLACWLAFRAQSLVGSVETRPKATVEYAAAILLLLVGWIGTYRDRDLVSASPGKAPREWPVTSWRQRAVVSLAVVINVLAVVELRRKDYNSLPAGAVWLASLLLLAAAAWVHGRGSGTAPREPGAKRAFLSRRLDLVVVLVIFALGLSVRVYRVGDWTGGMHGDEGEVGLNALEILRHPEISPFRTGWFGQPNFYYWGVAIGMKIFGRGLAGLRAFSIAAGALLLLPFYSLVRRLFGVRTAIVASILLAVSGPAIHFSRQEFSNITTPALLVAGFLFLVRGLESRRPLSFVLAGYAHMACLYFYLGGRLTPMIAAAFFAYLLFVAALAGASGAGPLQRRFGGIRPLLPAIGFYAAAAFCMAGPWAAYYADHRREWDSRVNEKLIFNRSELLAQVHGARHEPLVLELPRVGSGPRRSIAVAKDGFWPRVLWGQLKDTLSILTWNFDRSGVYITTKPATTPLEAPLVVLGIAWALGRWRDGPMAMLSIWFWMTVGVGGVLTIDAPYLARLVGILPLLPIFSAIILDKLALEVERLWRRSTRGTATDARFVLTVVTLLFVTVLGRRNLRDYFVGFLGSRPFGGGISFASFVHDTDARARKEGRPAPKYYAMGVHYVYWHYSVNRFLNPGSVGRNVENASDTLPLLDNDGRDAVFLIWGSNRQYLPVIKLYYPEGEEGVYLYGMPGLEAEMFRYYRVPRDQIDARRRVVARYVSARGIEIERHESGLGSTSSPPDGLAYPARAEWKGQLVAPAFGRYGFRLESTGPARLSLDGTQFLTAMESWSETEVVLARGTHAFELSGVLPDPGAKILLSWGVEGAGHAAVPRRFLWSGPGGSLLGEVRWTEEQSGHGKEFTEYRTDGFLGFRNAQETLGAGHPFVALWKGSIRLPAAGAYGFETFSNGASAISIDGRVVLDNHPHGLAPERRSSRVELSAGEHPLEVVYRWNSGFGHLEVYGIPPGGGRAILGAADLSARGGVWRPGMVRESRKMTADIYAE